MNEITRIHLAKVAYDIEIDAKKKLERYIHEIEGVTHERGMLYEIELRMVELLAERGVAAGGVIALDDVRALQQTLGSAKDFSDDETTTSNTEESEKSERKFFRDESNGMIGGVCSGIAAYFAIDVWLVRIAALALLVLTSGGIALAYIALMLFIPAAKTASDRLQMAGRSTTIQALKDIPPMPISVSRMVQFTRTAARVFATMVVVGAIIGVTAMLAMGLVLAFSLFDFGALPLVGVFIGLGSAGLVAVILALIALVIMLVKLAAPKRLVATFWVASIVAVVLGATAMIGIAASGHYMTSDQTQDVVTKKEVSLAGVKKLSLSSNNMMHITYIVTNSKSYAETHRPKYLKEQPINITVSGTDEKQLAVIPTMSTLCRFTSAVCGATGEVTVYGPALEEVSIGSGVQFTYKNNAPQPQLKLTYQDGVSGGSAHVETLSIDMLAIVVRSSGINSADITATKVGTITAATATDSQLAINVNADTDAIRVRTDATCALGADKTVYIMYKSVQTITVQDQPMTLPRDDQLQTAQGCVTAQPVGRNFEKNTRSNSAVH